MIGYYNYTVVLTYIGTLFGFAGISYTYGDNLKMALICLMCAGFCDMFDGKIASTRKRTREEKRFGIQIDSLSDLICFGVLPALIVFRCAGETQLHLLISFAYVLCALIRLAWFNVDEEERQESEAHSRKTYLGLPVTTAALLIPCFFGGAHLMRLPVQALCPWMMLIIALAFITPFSLKKPESTGKLLILLLGIAALALLLIGVEA